MKPLAAALLLLASTARADEWTPADTAFQLAYTAAHVADYGQTLDIADKCGRVWPDGVFHPKNPHELNPVLGRCPARGKVHAYMLSTLVAHVVVARLLPQPYRRLWQVGGLGVEVYWAQHNARMGLNFAF